MLQPDEMGLLLDRPWEPTYHSPLLDRPVEWTVLLLSDDEMLSMALYPMPPDWRLVQTPELSVRLRRMLVEFVHEVAPRQ